MKSTLLGLSVFVGGPALGALCAIALGYTRLWQIVIGALIGAAVADVAIREWSNHVAERLMHDALDSAGVGREAVTRSPGDLARPSRVIVRATGLGWRDPVVTTTVLITFAAIVGSVVALVRRIIVAYR